MLKKYLHGKKLEYSLNLQGRNCEILKTINQIDCIFRLRESSVFSLLPGSTSLVSSRYIYFPFIIY